MFNDTSAYIVRPSAPNGPCGAYKYLTKIGIFLLPIKKNGKRKYIRVHLRHGRRPRVRFRYFPSPFMALRRALRPMRHSVHRPRMQYSLESCSTACESNALRSSTPPSIHRRV